MARQHGLGAITYYTFASGFLSGKYTSKGDIDQSQRGGGVEKYLYSPRGQALLKALEHVAKRHTVQPVAVAIAWGMRNPDVSAPIASATKAKHLDEFDQAVKLSLTDEDLRQLDIPEAEADH